MGTLARMDAISALFSDWASGLSGGGGGGSLSVVAVSRMSISTPEGVCERGGGQWELRRRHGIPGARHGRRLREGLGRDARCVVGAAKLVCGSESRSEYDQLGERHGASEHETRMSCQKEESRRTRRPARNFTDDNSSRYALRKIKVRFHVSGRPHVQRSLSVYVCGRRTKMREVHGTHAWAALLE